MLGFIHYYCVVKCYRCDSTQDDCTEDEHGEKVECAESNSCTISMSTLGNSTAMTRDCSGEVAAKCDTIEEGEDGKVTLATPGHHNHCIHTSDHTVLHLHSVTMQC